MIFARISVRPARSNKAAPADRAPVAILKKREGKPVGSR